MTTSVARPFVFRKYLDFGAINAMRALHAQIRQEVTRKDRIEHIKLGPGGIREIEFIAQVFQLIRGGRESSLQIRPTLLVLDRLGQIGQLAASDVTALTAAYATLRGLEHRVQMLDDEQTHILPADPARRTAVAALAGEGDLTVFDRGVEALLVGVNRRYGELFEGGEELSSPYGSLVFTGVENDPETLLTLERMGFTEPGTIADTIRSWHHGRIPATRSARGRELFTRLAPRLLTALAPAPAAADPAPFWIVAREGARNDPTGGAAR